MRAAASRIGGRLHVGAGFFARRGLVVDGQPRGLVDRIADLANPGLDVARIHPAIVPFFEDTAALDLEIHSRWRGPMIVVWLVARCTMWLAGQFVLPLRRARIATRVVAIDAAADGRADARGVIRTYAGGGVMQVVAYATWARNGTRYMSASFPMPLGKIAGILRLDANGEDPDGHLAVALTSARRAGDDAGVWFAIGRLAIPLPLGERLALWGAGMACAPADLSPGDATIVGRHEQRLFGIRFVTHDYRFRPLDRAARARS